MDSNQARSDLDFVKAMMRRAGDRIDARAFHFVHWGLIVAIWYPLANWFQDQGKTQWMAGLGIGAVVLGSLISWLREMRLRDTTRLPGENTLLGRRIGIVVAGCIATGIALSAIACSGSGTSGSISAGSLGAPVRIASSSAPVVGAA